MDAFLGEYTSKKAAGLRGTIFDRKQLGVRGLKYERLDQLTVELIMGVR
jgi:xylose isomerase